MSVQVAAARPAGKSAGAAAVGVIVTLTIFVVTFIAFLVAPVIALIVAFLAYTAMRSRGSRPAPRPAATNEAGHAEAAPTTTSYGFGSGAR